MLAALASYLQSERDRRRQQEDQDLQYQQEMIHGLINRPDFNPAYVGQAMHDLLELQGAKGGRGKKAKGAAGDLGSHDLPISQFLAGVHAGTTPIMGHTMEPVPPPQTPAQQGLMPQAQPIIHGGPTLKDFSGQDVLQTPVMIPPAPIEAPPEAGRMLDAARQVQKYNEGPKMRPVANQPILRSPDEMAQEAADREAMKSAATTRGMYAADFDAARQLAALPPGVQETVRGMRGIARGPMPHLTKGPMMEYPDGQRLQAFETIGADGKVRAVDQNGLDLPPGGKVVASGASGMAQTTDKMGNVWVIDKIARTASMVAAPGGVPPAKPMSGKYVEGTGPDGKAAAKIISLTDGSTIADVPFDSPAATAQSNAPNASGAATVPTPPPGPTSTAAVKTFDPNEQLSEGDKRLMPDGRIATVQGGKLLAPKAGTASAQAGAVPPPPTHAGFTPGKPPKLTAEEQRELDLMAKVQEVVPKTLQMMQQRYPGIEKNPAQYAGVGDAVHQLGATGGYKLGIIHQGDVGIDTLTQALGYLEAVVPRMLISGRINQQQYNDLKQHAPNIWLSPGANYVRIKNALDMLLPIIGKTITEAKTAQPQ